MTRRILLLLVPAALGLTWSRPATAVALPAIFSDHMVLQRGRPVPIWGWGEAGESVTVAFRGQEKTATADAGGRWLLDLDALPASAEPCALIVRGKNTVTFRDVLVGDVWVLGGPGIAEPVAARYGWADFPEVNLDNREGLPASPFRTDDFPVLATGADRGVSRPATDANR